MVDAGWWREVGYTNQDLGNCIEETSKHLSAETKIMFLRHRTSPTPFFFLSSGSQKSRTRFSCEVLRSCSLQEGKKVVNPLSFILARSWFSIESALSMRMHKILVLAAFHF